MYIHIYIYIYICIYMICFNDLFMNFCAYLFCVCVVVVAISLPFGASMD